LSDDLEAGADLFHEKGRLLEGGEVSARGRFAPTDEVGEAPLDFTVENRGTEPMSVSDIGLYVYDSQDRQFETETDVPFGYIPEDRDLFLLDRLNPGLSQDVRVVFSVPPDTQGFEMEVSSGFFGTETRRIALGL
jgi:hypothetical protein